MDMIETTEEILNGSHTAATQGMELEKFEKRRKLKQTNRQNKIREEKGPSTLLPDSARKISYARLFTEILAKATSCSV